MAETATETRFHVAKNVARMQPSSTLAAMQAALRLRSEGHDVVDFGPGEPDFLEPPFLLAPFFEPPFEAQPPFLPPFFAGPLFSDVPRPEPLFLPPPEVALTVAHARRSASSSEAPRSS